MRWQWLIAAAAGACLTGVALAQDSAPQAQQPPEQEPVYFPLFSEEMIRSASPEQAVRMRDTEARNREAFDARQQALRAQRTNSKDNAQRDRNSPPAVRIQRGRSKVFKWVDANGHTHFGDTPPGKGAQEVQVGGAARIQGTPPPPPGRSADADDGKL